MASTGSDQMTSAWPALCLRLAVVTLPAQLVGAFVGFLPTMVLGSRVLAVPWLPSLVLVGMGVASGLAVGLLAHPPVGRLGAAVVVAAAFGLAGFLILRLLVQIRLPPGATTTVLAWLLGGLVIMVLQSVVVLLVWRLRALRT